MPNSNTKSKGDQLQMRSISLLSCLLGLVLVLPASGQQASPAATDQTVQASAAAAADAAPATAAPAQDTQAPAATSAAAPTWSVGPIDFSGEVDAYYQWNFNHPANRQTGLANFAIPANQFSLEAIELGLAHTPDPIGFEVDLGYGKTFQVVNSFDNDRGFNQYVRQAFVSLKPMKTHGFEFDFGKFVTTSGAEVIESYTNWNYSHSLLLAWAIPYYHFGFRTSWPMGKHWVGGFQVVNGWNNLVDNNSGKTLGVNLTGTFKKFAWVGDWYGGPENPNTNSGWRNLFDTTLTLTPSSKVSVYINYDYGQNRNFNQSFLFLPPTGPARVAFADGSLARWQGVAGALHLQATSKWAFTPRVEWFDDRSGFQMLGAGADSFGTGVVSVNNIVPVPQQVKEVTITGEYKVLEGLMFRAEYRHDWSNRAFFERGQPACVGFTVTTCPADFGLGNSKKQDTVALAFIAFFGPKR
jgi:hypothetical protein